MSIMITGIKVFVQVFVQAINCREFDGWTSTIDGQIIENEEIWKQDDLAP